MRLAFVLARYGPSVLGGAEALSAGLSRTAAAHGCEVEIWTTCALDAVTWENVVPRGVERDAGVTVRRFEIDPWDPAGFHRLNYRMFYHVGLERSQEYDWVRSGPQSSALYSHVRRESPNFDVVVVMPYLSTINFGAASMASNVIVWPCLHNEMHAHMEPTRLLLESAYGVVFISPEEARFATEDLRVKPVRSTVIGAGVSPEPASGIHSYAGKKPNLLYIGRLEPGKNVRILYEYVRRYVEEGGDLHLLVAGDGPCKPPEGPMFSYAGAVSEDDKKELMCNALALCQPSKNESFSIVIMESWLAGRPVLVSSECAVTKGHVQRSKGGLWFGDYTEFKAAVQWLIREEALSDRMGQNGRQYVSENFTWDHIFRKFEHTLSAWNVG